MARITVYQMDDGTVVKPENAIDTWFENETFNGSNHVGRITRHEANRQTLHKSRRGRYWIEYLPRDGTPSYARWIDKRAAAAWLLLNGDEVPEDLEADAEEVSE